MKNKKKIIGYSVILILIVLVITRLITNKAKLDEELQVLVEYQGMVPVEVHITSKQLPIDRITETGIFKSMSEIAIVSETQGTALTVNGRIGEFVQAGSILVSIEKGLIEEQLKLARLNLQNAESDMERFATLIKGHAVTKQQFEAMQLNRMNAQTNLTALEKQLSNTRIVASVSGYITERRVEPGSFVAPGTPIMIIAQQTGLLFSVRVSESVVRSLKKGQNVSIIPSVHPDKSITGRVKEIAMNAAMSGRYNIDIEITDNESLLKPGMTGVAVFQMEAKNEQIIIPRQCIVGGILEAEVYVIENDTAILKPIKLIALNVNEVIVLDGLRTGEKVVRTGQINLEDGTKVRIIN